MRYWAIMTLILGWFLALFLMVEALGVPLLTDQSPWLERCVGLGLLGRWFRAKRR